MSVSDYDEGDTLLDKTTYVYDAFDRRIGKHFDTDGDGLDRDEFYVYDGSDIVMDFVDADGETAENRRYLRRGICGGRPRTSFWPRRRMMRARTRRCRRCGP